MNASRFKKWLLGLMVTSFALLGTGLVITDILRRFEWQVPFIPTQDTTAPAQDEIRKYVQFTDVTFGVAAVTTGVERASDQDRQITSQWCYIAGSIGGGRFAQVTLATKDGSGVLSITTPSQSALSDFDLTRPKARQLITSHCRFQ